MKLDIAEFASTSIHTVVLAGEEERGCRLDNDPWYGVSGRPAVVVAVVVVVVVAG